MMSPSLFLCEPRELVGEWNTEFMGRGWGRSSSSEGVPGAPFMAAATRMDSGETTGDQVTRETRTLVIDQAPFCSIIF